MWARECTLKAIPPEPEGTLSSLTEHGSFTKRSTSATS